MNLNDYQAKAVTTALPTAFDLGYLIPGLVAEAAEVAELFEVEHWESQEEFLHELKSEVGDVLWFTALIANEYLYALDSERFLENIGEELEADTGIADDVSTTTYLFSLFLSCGAISGFYAKGVRDSHGDIKAKHIESLFEHVASIAATALQLAHDRGIAIEEVLEYNISKLFSRKDRGVLGGSGNDR